MEIKNKTIGFIGFGAMGSRIVKNFVEAGYRVKGYNRTLQKVAQIDGVVVANSPAEVAKDVDAVFVMVRDDKASEAVWFDPEVGVLTAIGPDTTAIDMSTLSLATTKKISARLQEAGISFLEAPVVGTRPQAEAKQLVVLAAGSEAAFEKVQPILDTTAAKVLNLGEVGAGAALKLVINSLFGIQTIAFAELTQSLRNFGYNDEKIMTILPELPVTSPIMKMMLGLMVNQKFDPQFPIELVEKDFGYTREFVESMGLRPLLTSEVQKIYAMAQKEGLGEQNISAAIKLYDYSVEHDKLNR